ncbi:MAG: threonine synthase [Lachnospiraceae bacterium]|nr:threonine synthase [Lachnospiraceae bacterium]
MLYQSTRGKAEAVSSVRAVLNGLAEDGGLYMPSAFPRQEAFEWKALIGRPFTEMAEAVFSYFLDDYPDIAGIVRRAYRGKFDTEEVTPLKKVGDRFVLELFHGPTSAFKDVALSALPVLMSDAIELAGQGEEILILTATSGDTGKAAMEGFRDVERIRIIVFYPYGGVSPVQEKQMTSQAGKNVQATAIRGNFDDAQTAVKSIFKQAAEQGMPAGTHTVLSSANSINIGRLVPQIVYYFKAYSDLVGRSEIQEGDPIDFTVPTGNFGDILAGYFAKRMGLPIRKLVCASNENNVLTDFLETGRYDRNRPFFKTSSPSMDILVSSNLERLLYLLYRGDGETVRGLMEDLSSVGTYTVSEEVFERLSEEFSAGFADDVETADTIREVYERYGCLLDPHTAVAWFVATTELFREQGNAVPNVVLSTASPYKFPKDVLNALGYPAPGDPFEVMDELCRVTGVPIPKNLAALRGLPVRFDDVIDRDEIIEYVAGKIRCYEDEEK